MLVKAPINQAIIEFLKKDHIINLNILGVINNVPEAEIYVDSPENPTGVLVKKNQYMHYLYSKNDDFIDDIINEYLKTGFYGFSAVESSIAEKIMNRFVVTWDSPVTVYYMPKENLNKELIKNPVSPIKIEKAEEVDKYYQYRSSDSLETIKKDILDRPSSAVYVEDDMACWVLIHEDDSMGIMYTKEEYRRKGYAVDVTIDLASKIIDKGKMPFIQIVKNNSMSPGLAGKCGFVEYGQAKWFGIISGTPEYLIKSEEQARKLLLDIVGEEEEELLYNPTYNYQGMYLSMYNFNNNFDNNDNFKLVSAIESDMVTLWCDVLSKVYGMNKETRDTLIKRIVAATSKEKPMLIPLLGLEDGKPVSVSALIEVDEEIYGICCLGGVDNSISLLELTLNQTLKIAKEKNGFLIFTQGIEEQIDIFEKIGFKSLTT